MCRWAEVDPERIALVWEKDEQGEVENVSYSQLQDMVGRIANTLKQV